MKKELGIFILLVVWYAVRGFENPRFFSSENLVNTADLIGLFAVFSLGTGMVIITSGIGFSIGSLMALNGLLPVPALTAWHWPGRGIRAGRPMVLWRVATGWPINFSSGAPPGKQRAWKNKPKAGGLSAEINS